MVQVCQKEGSTAAAISDVGDSVMIQAANSACKDSGRGMKGKMVLAVDHAALQLCARVSPLTADRVAGTREPHMQACLSMHPKYPYGHCTQGTVS